MTNAEAWFSIALRPRKPEGSLGRTAQDGQLDSHTAPELCLASILNLGFIARSPGLPIRSQELCEGRGGRPGHPVPFCGSKATFEEEDCPLDRYVLLAG